jgi:hypothetical protein
MLWLSRTAIFPSLLIAANNEYGRVARPLARGGDAKNSMDVFFRPSIVVQVGGPQQARPVRHQAR